MNIFYASKNHICNRSRFCEQKKSVLKMLLSNRIMKQEAGQENFLLACFLFPCTVRSAP